MPNPYSKKTLIKLIQEYFTKSYVARNTTDIEGLDQIDWEADVDATLSVDANIKAIEELYALTPEKEETKKDKQIEAINDSIEETEARIEMLADQYNLPLEAREEINKIIEPGLKALAKSKDSDRRVATVLQDTDKIVKQLNGHIETLESDIKSGKVTTTSTPLTAKDIKEKTRKLLIKKDSEINQKDRKITVLESEIAKLLAGAPTSRIKEMEDERDREKREKRLLQEQYDKLQSELAEERQKKPITIEKIVKETVYRDAPKPPTDPAARPPQTPKPQTSSQPKQSTEPRQGALISIDEKGIWTNKLLQELLDTYEEILILAGVNPRSKVAPFNNAIRRMMTPPTIEEPTTYIEKQDIISEITRIANDVALGNSRILSGIRKSLEKATGKQEVAPPTKGGRIKTGSDFGRDDQDGPDDMGGGFGYTEPKRDRKAGPFPRRLSRTEEQRFYDAYLASVPHASESKFDNWFGWETWISFEAAKIGLADIIAILNQEEEEGPLSWKDENDRTHYVNRDLVYTGVGGLVGGSFYADVESEENRVIRILWQRRANGRPHSASDLAAVLRLPLTSVEKAILNAYYANKDAAIKGLQPGEAFPFYLVSDYTKDDFEKILNRNIPDKRTNGAATL